MKTKYVIKGFIKNELVYFIGLKPDVLWNNEEFQVRQCSTTIDEATQYSSYDEALFVIRECELHGFDAYPICPNCNEDYDGHPAISRKDNKTEICPNCGIGEAFLRFCDYYQKNKTTN